MKSHVLILALIVLVSSSLEEVTRKFMQQQATHEVTFNIKIGDNDTGDIVLALFGNAAPKTVENFVTICQGTHAHEGKALSYDNTIFHRIIPNFMIQGGDMTNFDGTGGRSIYGRSFDDEQFVLKHEPFCLSMANAGPNTNGSQFFITTVNTSWLDGRHIVFGRVIGGKEVVKAVEAQGTGSGTPKKRVTIASCTARAL